MQIELLVDVDAAAGHVTGKRYDLSDADANAYITAGKAKAVAAATLPALPAGSKGADGATLTATVAEGIQTLIGNVYLAGIEAAEKKGGTGIRPEILQQLGQIGKYAQAKEEKSIAEWLWCVAHSTPSQQDKAEGRKAANLMANKYQSRFNPNFEQDWQKAQSAGTAFNMETKASVQVEGTGAVGGFAVPPEFFPEIQQIAYQESEIYRRVRKYQMTRDELNVPMLDYSKGGSGASPYLGGMVATWFAENVTLGQTNASLRQVQFKANILGGYTQASRQLVADNAVGFQQILVDLMGKTIAFYVTYAIVNGTGANQPKGITNEAAAISVTRTGDSTNGTMLADIATMKSKLLPGAQKRALWMIAPSTEAYLYQLNDAAGRAIYLPNFPTNMGGPASYPGIGQLLGIPLEINQYAASHGSAADIILVDPEGYGLAERQDIEIGVSEHVAYLTNLLTWRFLYRGDGRSRLNTYLTLQNGDTVSPFVYRHA